MDTNKHPKVWEAVKWLYNDQSPTGCPQPADYKLPGCFEEDDASGDAIDWDRVEKFLTTLSDDDLETFCIGEQEDMVAIGQRDPKDGDYAFRAVETLFMNIGM